MRDRPGAELRDPPAVACSTARTTSIPTAPRPTRSASTTSRSTDGAPRRRRRPRRHRPRAPRGGRGKLVHAGGGGRADRRRRVLAGRLQPLRHAAGRDRHRARHALAGAGRRVPRRCCATPCARSACPTATWRRARCAATPTSRCGRPARPAGHQDRAQEHELVQVPGRGHGGRDRAADASCSTAGGTVRAGDAALRPVGRGAALAAVEGGGARLPLLPGARPRAAGAEPPS